MKIAIVAPGAVPFAVGGAERLYDGLTEHMALSGRGECELVKIASPEHSFGQLLDSYEAFARLDLTRFDHVVSTKYPSWMVRHPSHYVYMLHTLRGLYDAYAAFGLPTEIQAVGPPIARLVRSLTLPYGTADGWQQVISDARGAMRALGADHPAFGFPGPLIRAVVQWLDRDSLDPSNVGAYAAISRTVAARSDYFPPGAQVKVLLPPTNLASRLHTGPYRAHFTVSRLDGAKRIDLIINAMEHVRGATQLRIGGTGPDEARLRSLRPGDPRIVFLGRISEDQLIAEYASALSVPFVPYDEDFGLVALEAQLAGKPVITCTDSGGVTEMVLDGVSGRVVPPEPAALGRAMNEFSHSPLAAQAMGEAALRTARSVSWAPIVESLLPPPSGSGDTGPASAPIGVLVASGRAAETVRPGGGSHSLAQMLSAQPAQQFPHDLLSELDRITGRASGRRTILVLSTYPAFPAVHGGQLRLNRLLRGLATRFDVELLALSLDRDRGITEPFPGIRQSVIPMSEEHQHLDRTLAAAAPIPIGDIAAALFVQHSSEFLDAVRQAGRGAVGVVLEHPYLLPALVRSHPTLPFVYDSQNAETEMKSQMLDGYRGAEDLVAVVRTVEREAVRRAELVVVCSTEDQRRLELLGGPTLARWAVVPNGADVFGTPFVEGEQRRVNREHWLAAYTTAQPDAQVRHLALFVGSYHPPNLQAATFLANLAPSLPQVCFILAGNLGLYFDGWRLPDNVLVTGQVSTPYLRQLLGAVDVALNPITTGGGTNLKLIEYFAAGAPVISTSLGTRGMRVENEGELLVCETGMFDEAIRSVVAEPKDAAERAARARKLAEQQYDWGPLARRFARTLDRCFSDGAPLH